MMVDAYTAIPSSDAVFSCLLLYNSVLCEPQHQRVDSSIPVHQAKPVCVDTLIPSSASAFPPRASRVSRCCYRR